MAYLLIDTDKLELTVDDNGKIVIPLGSFNMAVTKFVHCKDCKWYYGDYCGGFGDGAFAPEDGFCHNAERKEE